MRALRDRPTALERWTSRRTPGHEARHRRAWTRTPTRSTRSGCPKGAPDYLETVEITFPSGRTAEEICPTEIAVPGVVRAHGHADVPPLAGPPRATSTAPTSCASTSTRSRARRSPTPRGSPGWPRSCSRSSGCVGYPKTSGNRGVHIYVRIEPRLGVHRRPARRDRLRPRAGPARRRRHHRLVEGGARRADLRRLQPELPRPHDRLGLLPAPDPGRPGLHAADLGRARRGHRPARVQPVHRARPARRRRPLGRASTTRRTRWSRCCGSTRSCPAGRDALPARLPEDARRAAAGAAEQEGRGPLDRGRPAPRALSRLLPRVAHRPHQDLRAHLDVRVLQEQTVDDPDHVGHPTTTDAVPPRWRRRSSACPPSPGRSPTP